MNGDGQSDSPVVPAKPANKAATAEAEPVEERGLAKGNTESAARSGHRAGKRAPRALDRVRQVAKRDKEARFTALLHHVNVESLRAAYWRLHRQAAPGEDGVRWKEYGQNLEANLQDLHDRIHRGAYRPKPSRRVYIPKADGRQRPLGIAATEDKIVQSAVVEVLNAIYEEDFLGFSYGFRPGRKPHDALDALTTGLRRRRVGWVLDADIRDFYTCLDHGWLTKFLEHRIGDPRVLRLIQKWIKAGVIEDGNWTESEEGTPQGATASPLLANVYLHYAFDQWADWWRRRRARGDMIVVRYADDCVPRTLKEVQWSRENRWRRCCTRDGGRPSGVALQGEAPNRRQLRRHNGRGGERDGKGAPPVRQVRARKANVDKPLITCRKHIDDVETGRSR